VLSRTVYVGFSTHRPRDWKWLVSWAIRKLQRAPYSHVYVRFPSESLQRDLIYEASGTTVHFAGAESFARSSRVIKEYEVRVSQESFVHALQWAIDNLGKPYGTRELLGAGWVCVGRMFGKKFRNPLGDGARSFVCSELAAAVLGELGFTLGGDLDTQIPRDVDDFLATWKFPVRFPGPAR